MSCGCDWTPFLRMASERGLISDDEVKRVVREYKSSYARHFATEQSAIWPLISALVLPRALSHWIYVRSILNSDHHEWVDAGPRGIGAITATKQFQDHEKAEILIGHSTSRETLSDAVIAASGIFTSPVIYSKWRHF